MKKSLPYLEAIFTTTVWGASFIATKVALQDALPVTVVWMRFAVGVLMLGLVVVARKQMSLPTLKEAGYFALLGFIGISFHQWLQSTGLVTAQASTTAWIVSTIPVFTALLGVIFLKEKLSLLQIGGIALSTAGVLLVVSKGDWSSLFSGRFGTPGDFLILISAPNWAIYTVLSRPALKKRPATWVMFYVMLFGWLFSSAQFIVQKGYQDMGHFSLNGLTALAFLGLFASGLAYIAWYDALQAIPASQVGTFLYIEPLVAVLVAAIVLKEPLLAGSIVGGGIILAGVWMVNKR